MSKLKWPMHWKLVTGAKCYVNTNMCTWAPLKSYCCSSVLYRNPYNSLKNVYTYVLKISAHKLPKFWHKTHFHRLPKLCWKGGSGEGKMIKCSI